MQRLPHLGTTAIAAPLRRAAASVVPEPIARLTDRRRLAVVPLRGVIGGQLHARDATRLLDRLREDVHTRGVLLDVDSPGGGAVESEAIYLSVKRLAAAKPVVAYLRGTGASGAYFLACGAQRILAFPSAIVGSIGVISVRPVLVDALRRIGAAVLVTKTGPFKDLGAPWREPTEADRAKDQSLVDAVFRRFRDTVAAERHLDGADLERVTTGEVWLADEAVKLGLVDAVCEPDDALDEALRLAGDLSRQQVRRHDRRRTVAQRMGLPGAGMGPPSARWLVEMEAWLRSSRPLLL
ncbi:MAG TPA: signal peptide peptidase SppA [Candidatus Dormibacteraeota bacterium]|nr:signal peptide peptidase SppA [Candidatus Dormibacteraeota bacterium]